MGNYTFDLFFYLFPTLAIFSSFLVIFSPNPIYSALFLISVFLNSSPPLSLLDHEFSASIFVIIYIGAIMVLFLFIIMMLDIKYSVMHLKVYYYYLISGFLIMLIAFEFLALVGVDLPLNLDDTITVPYVN
jgi:NADH-quinone oxidoreductase subunit J